MSENLWITQFEINKLIDKRIALSEAQLTALTDLVIEQGKLLQQLAKATEPTEPTGCVAKHCACSDIGEL